MPGSTARFDIVVVGVSAGGVDLLLKMLPLLPVDFPVPIVICQHAAADTTRELAKLFDGRAAITVQEARDKERPRPGTVYLAPGGFHLLLEDDGSFSLSLDAPVRFSRPSIDVLFDSAAHAFRHRVLAVVLTGANDDGAEGAQRVKAVGGTLVVQEPASANAPEMPEAVLAVVKADYRVEPDALPGLLQKLCANGMDHDQG